MNVEQLSEKIAALYISSYFFLSLIQYRPLSSVFIYMSRIEIIELPRIYDPRGSLSVAEENTHIPFDIKKVEWNHIGAIQPDAPIELGESPMMLIALAGEITIQVIDEDARTITLNRPNQALVLKEGCRSRITHSTKQSLLLTIHQK